jgi:hypothetical protein
MSRGTPQIISAVHLMEMRFADTPFVVEGLLPAGLALLGGKPKRGKSWLALNLAVAVAGGGAVLGNLSVEVGEVLYLALEDTKRRLKERLNTMLTGGFSAPSSLYLTTKWAKLDDGGLVELQCWLDEHPHARLIIVDTLARVRTAQGQKDNANLYTSDYSALEGLKALADKYRVLILVVHHLRKAGADDPLDEISGTTGLTGCADTVILLRRKRSVTTLYVVGRDVDEQEIAIRFDSLVGRWLQGEDMRSRERHDILEVVRQAGEESVTPRDVAKELGRTEPSTRWIMADMAKDGELARVGYGQYKLTESQTKQMQTPPTTQTLPTPSVGASVGGETGEIGPIQIEIGPSVCSVGEKHRVERGRRSVTSDVTSNVLGLRSNGGKPDAAELEALWELHRPKCRHCGRWTACIFASEWAKAPGICRECAELYEEVPA